MKLLAIIKTLFDKKKNNAKDLMIEELTKQEEKKDKLLLTTMWIFLTVILAFFVIICWMAVTYMPEDQIQLTIILVSVVLLLISCLYILKLEVEAGYYQCKKCNHRHKSSYKDVLLSMHIGTTRYLKCPKCHQRSWSKKVLRK